MISPIRMLEGNNTINFFSVGPCHQIPYPRGRSKYITLVDRTLLLYVKQYWTAAITTMFCSYSPKAFSENLNNLKVNEYVVIPTDNFLEFQWTSP